MGSGWDLGWLFGKWEDRVQGAAEPYLANNLPENNDVVDTYPIKNAATMNALQQLEIGTEQKIEVQEIERQNSINKINNLMNMALNDSKRVIDGDQYNALFKAFRANMPDAEATKSFIAANYVMQDDYNSWYMNSGYFKQDSYKETIVVNASTEVASDGNLIVTTHRTDNSAPTLSSTMQNFGSGLYDAGENAVSSIWNMGKHPIETAKNLGNALLHPIDTGEAIWKGVSTSFEEDVINGDANTRAHFAGRAIGEVGVGILGTKGLDKAVKVIRGGEAVAETANIVKGASKDGNVYHAVGTPSQAQSVLNGIDPRFFNPNSRFGGGFYITSDGNTAIAELTAHNMEASYALRYNMNLSNQKVLDLTNPSIAKQWGYTTNLSTEACQAIAINARSQGYDVITFSSYRGSGTNYAIYDKFNEILSPQMVTPTK